MQNLHACRLASIVQRPKNAACGDTGHGELLERPGRRAGLDWLPLEEQSWLLEEAGPAKNSSAKGSCAPQRLKRLLLPDEVEDEAAFAGWIGDTEDALLPLQKPSSCGGTTSGGGGGGKAGGGGPSSSSSSSNVCQPLTALVS